MTAAFVAASRSERVRRSLCPWHCAVVTGALQCCRFLRTTKYPPSLAVPADDAGTGAARPRVVRHHSLVAALGAGGHRPRPVLLLRRALVAPAPAGGGAGVLAGPGRPPAISSSVRCRPWAIRRPIRKGSAIRWGWSISAGSAWCWRCIRWCKRFGDLKARRKSLVAQLPLNFLSRSYAGAFPSAAATRSRT